MADKALDYCMKGLPIGVRQKLFYHMKTEISGTMIRWFLEKKDGYPSFRSCGFSDDEIELISETYAEKFEHTNQIMAENGRPPLFSNPHDSYRSAHEHAELMKERSDEEPTRHSKPLGKPERKYKLSDGARGTPSGIALGGHLDLEKSRLRHEGRDQNLRGFGHALDPGRFSPAWVKSRPTYHRNASLAGFDMRVDKPYWSIM